MSHHNAENITCPNCGHHTTLNYCAQCGQETHLHKETFWGLIMHFVGHYFHYDSKFWKTIKTLIAKPGELTVAYWNKQRARYIPPISLYIFISTTYFVAMYMLTPLEMKQFEKTSYGKMTDSSMAASYQQSKIPDSTVVKDGKPAASNRSKAYKSINDLQPFFEKVQHNQPKVFFFMVPFLALLLKLLFVRRKDVYYVEHAIYSLHFHTTGFILSFLQSLILCFFFTPIISLLFYFVLIVYSVVGLQYVYKITMGRAIWYTMFLGIVFMIISVVISIGLMFITDREVLMGVFDIKG